MLDRLFSSQMMWGWIRTDNVSVLRLLRNGCISKVITFSVRVCVCVCVCVCVFNITLRPYHLAPGCTRPLTLRGLYDCLPLYESPVGQADAVLPQDVGHGQRDAHVSGNVSQPLVKLLKLLGRWQTKHRRTCSWVIRRIIKKWQK